MTDLSALLARPGANDIAYTLPGLPGRQMMLRSARPVHCTPDTPIVFVHHGMGRNGDDYRDYWLPLVDEADVLVVAPEFPTVSFPGAEWYNYGNRTDASGALNGREQWSYQIDTLLFQALRAQGLTRRASYGLFGHSAGGQFVHRLLGLGLRDHVAAAVTANAGSYALADLAIDFPFGLGGTGLAEADLRAWLGFRLTVMAGTADSDPDGGNLPREPQAMAQGPHRHARAHHFIAAARAKAESLGMRCAWTIIDVDGVAHDGCRMSAAAAPVLSAALHAAG